MATQFWKFALLLLEFVAVHGQSQTPETCEGETCEEGVFMQVRSMPASFLELSMAQIRSGARGAPVEQLKQQLRGMAMARVGAGSGDPNYTVWNISQANFSAVFASIKEDMEAIIDEIELSATRDNNQLELARGAVADCNTQLNRSVPQHVQDLGALHRACRVQEAADLAARDAAFLALEAHLQNPISVQDCLQDFGRGGCEVNDITSTEYVQRALECSEAIRDWAGTYYSQLDTLQSTYDSAVAAYEGRKTKECNVDQQEFEIGYCTLRTQWVDQCSGQHTCYDSAQSLFNSTRDLILQSNASRYVAYTSARQVQCYIDVLSTDNLTASAVDSCDQAQFDTSNLTLNIPELPAKPQCEISDDHFPCAQAWIAANYGDFPPAAPLAACRPCAVATTPPTSAASVRLVDGDTPRSGRLEIFHSGQWGSVCDDLFDDNAAEVVCHQLGYLGGTSLGRVGGGSGPVWMDQVACTGSETHLWDCNFAGWGSHNCSHQEDVGVRCQAGWVQLNTSMSPPPSARDSASLVVANGAEAYLFGGRGDGPIRLGDFWKLTIQADDQARWTQITPMIGTPPSPRQNHVSVWTGSSRNSILIFSGYDLPTYDSEAMNDLYEFNLNTSTWSQLNPDGIGGAGSPSKRLHASAIWVPGRGMLMYGGAYYVPTLGRLADLWELSFSQYQTGFWTLLDGNVEIAGARSEHVSVWASNLGSGGKMLIYGGVGASGSILHSIVAYDPNIPSGGRWEYFSSAGAVALYATSAAWSPSRRSMRVFGGRTLTDEQNDVREWSSDGGWKLVDDLSGTIPPKRRLHQAVWMAREDGSEAMVIFGGVTGSTRYQDTWRLLA